MCAGDKGAFHDFFYRAMLHIHRVSKICANLFFGSVLTKYEPISIKIGKRVLGKHSLKLYKKCPLHLKCVLALPWEI